LFFAFSRSSFSLLPGREWQVLGVPRGAGEAQIKNAYRKLAIQYHPDKTSGVCVVLSAMLQFV